MGNLEIQDKALCRTSFDIHRLIIGAFAIFSFIVGTAIYIIFRPTSLLMFKWATALSLTEQIDTLRFYVQGSTFLLPSWIIYSFPFALWVLSSLLFFKVVWWKSKSESRYFWFLIIPTMAIMIEFFQLAHLLPGTFDIVDIIATSVATVFVISASILNYKTFGGKQR